jgi:hypothetical protein
VACGCLWKPFGAGPSAVGMSAGLADQMTETLTAIAEHEDKWQWRPTLEVRGALRLASIGDMWTESQGEQQRLAFATGSRR